MIKTSSLICIFILIVNSAIAQKYENKIDSLLISVEKVESDSMINEEELHNIIAILELAERNQDLSAGIWSSPKIYKLMYNFFEYLKESDRGKEDVINFFHELNLVVRSNTELKNYLWDVNAELAVENPELFLKSLNSIDSIRDKNVILESLSFIKGPDNFKKFIKGIEKVEGFKSTKELVHEKINKVLDY